MLEISAVAEVLLSLMVQKGAEASVPEKFNVTDDTLLPLTIEPRISVDPAVIEAQPVPHVGVPPLPVRAVLHVIAVDEPPPLVSNCPAVPAVIGRFQLYVPAAACGCSVIRPLVFPASKSEPSVVPTTPVSMVPLT